jgi:hypothetical protein
MLRMDDLRWLFPVNDASGRSSAPQPVIHSVDDRRNDGLLRHVRYVIPIWVKKLRHSAALSRTAVPAEEAEAFSKLFSSTG